MTAINYSSGVVKAQPKFNPSPYQQGVADWVRDGLGTGRHLIVQACAGSGKTTTGVWIFYQLPSGLRVAYVAFNKHIADELKSRLPEGSGARTYHSLGRAVLQKNMGRLNIQLDKVESYLKRYASNQKWIIPSTKRLVSLCKSTADARFSEHDLMRIAFEHDIDLYEDNGNSARDIIFGFVQRALEYSIGTPDMPDFDDMIWLPNVLDGLSFEKYDFILGDEFQDTNLAQARLVMNSISDSGTIVGVGDRWQSIYRFRGAASNAMDNLKMELNADELPLSLSYRCPVAVGQLVNAQFPHIRFEFPDWAKPGKVYDVKASDVAKQIRPDDMVLCRVNADLMSMALSLIRSGIKATVRGRDIGRGLQALIVKSKTSEVPDLFEWLHTWESKEIDKAMRIGAESKIQNIQDKVETILAISDGANSVAEIIGRCETMFSDEKSAVTLSTIHKSKGEEANRVFILRPDLLPHPAAKRDEDLRQEDNLAYVSYTRSKDELIFVR